MDFMSRAWGPQIYHECLYDALKQETNCSEVAGCQGVTGTYQARSHSGLDIVYSGSLFGKFGTVN